MKINKKKPGLAHFFIKKLKILQENRTEGYEQGRQLIAYQASLSGFK